MRGACGGASPPVGEPPDWAKPWLHSRITTQPMRALVGISISSQLSARKCSVRSGSRASVRGTAISGDAPSPWEQSLQGIGRACVRGMRLARARVVKCTDWHRWTAPF